MSKKIKVFVVPIDHWFESEKDKELFFKIHTGQPLSAKTTKKASQNDTAPIMWIGEAVKYLGLDRTGIKRPDKAIHRLIKKGALHPRKISGRLVFDKAELDKVIANGDHKRGRGRPRKPNTA